VKSVGRTARNGGVKTPASDGADRGSPAVRVIADRIAAGRRELARRMIDRCRKEIADYELIDDDEALADFSAFALETVDALTASLTNGPEFPADRLEQVRSAAQRRVHQRVSLEAFLHAQLVTARVIWEAVLDQARSGRPDELEAALTIAGRLLSNGDLVATVATAAYLDELSDRGLLRHDLLDALIAGHGDTERTRRRAGALRLQLGENYVVVVIRAPEIHAGDARQPPLPAQVALDRLVDATRSQLRPDQGALLAGMRHGDVVALYPVSGAAGLAKVRRECTALIEALAMDVGVGMSGWHAGLPAIASAYEEALDAADLAVVAGIRGRAVALEEVLVDHMVRSSAHANRILAETLRPVIDYDRAHNANLLTTLRTYLETRLNLTRSAQILCVNPNTVSYRLRRIRELSGRDPRNGEDLLVLSLAVRLEQLRTPQ